MPRFQLHKVRRLVVPHQHPLKPKVTLSPTQVKIANAANAVRDVVVGTFAFVASAGVVVYVGILGLKGSL